jgi:hypothetical protein
MTNLAARILGFLIGEDEAINALTGGATRETISGTVGRACGYPTPDQARWWGPAFRAVIEVMPWFGAGHCLRQAVNEHRRRDAEAQIPQPPPAQG